MTAFLVALTEVLAVGVFALLVTLPFWIVAFAIWQVYLYGQEAKAWNEQYEKDHAEFMRLIRERYGK